MTKLFNTFKNPVFGPFLDHLPSFGDKKNVFWKSGSVTHNLILVSSNMPNLKKTNDIIPRKRPDRRQDGQTLFYRTLLVTAGGPKKH